MGVCASKPEGCVGGKLKFSKRQRKSRKASSRLKKSLSLNNNKLVPIDESSGFHELSAFANPTFRVSLDDAWFDTHAVLEADWDDDFYSIQEDSLSTIDSESSYQSNFFSPRCHQSPGYGCFSCMSSITLQQSMEKTDIEASKQDDDQNTFSFRSMQLTQSDHDQDQYQDVDFQDDSTPTETSFEDPESCDHTSSNSSDALPLQIQELDSNTPLKLHNNNKLEVKASVVVFKVCSHEDEDDGVRVRDSPELDNYSMVQNSCLPCLRYPSAVGTDRRRSISPSPPSTRKKAALKVLSFKWKDDCATPALVSPRAPLQRPIAGSQIPYCPPEKKMSDCWSPIDPSTFKVRGHSYLRDKRKDLAPMNAAYYPFGVDVFQSRQKINHIARFVELPPVFSHGKIPPILIVNIQIPLYPASVFHREDDGEGLNVVMYFRLSDTFSKDLPRHFQENVRRLIDDEKEKIKSFPVETVAPFRERLKILGRLANLDELNLNAAEKKLLNAYNEKPVLSRPQHEFYSGENYFEIDIDVHRFSYICRKGIDAIQDRLKHCVLDLGITIQGMKPEDLPEHLLCCVRLNEIDYTNYRHLAI